MPGVVGFTNNHMRLCQDPGPTNEEALAPPPGSSPHVSVKDAKTGFVIQGIPWGKSQKCQGNEDYQPLPADQGTILAGRGIGHGLPTAEACAWRGQPKKAGSALYLILKSSSLSMKSLCFQS